MKKSISFSIEEDIFQRILMYQAEHKLSNRSQALERIVLGLDNNQPAPQSNQFNTGITPELLAAAFDILQQQQQALSMEISPIKTTEKVENTTEAEKADKTSAAEVAQKPSEAVNTSNTAVTKSSVNSVNPATQNVNPLRNLMAQTRKSIK